MFWDFREVSGFSEQAVFHSTPMRLPLLSEIVGACSDVCSDVALVHLRVELFRRRYLRKAVYACERFFLPLPARIGRAFRDEDLEVHEWLGCIVALPKTLFPSWAQAMRFLRTQESARESTRFREESLTQKHQD